MWALAYSYQYSDDNPCFCVKFLETEQDADNFIYLNRKKLSIIQHRIEECKVGDEIDIDGDPGEFDDSDGEEQYFKNDHNVEVDEE
jgi:hypothetical protein